MCGREEFLKRKNKIQKSTTTSKQKLQQSCHPKVLILPSSLFAGFIAFGTWLYLSDRVKLFISLAPPYTLQGISGTIGVLGKIPHGLREVSIFSFRCSTCMLSISVSRWLTVHDFNPTSQPCISCCMSGLLSINNTEY